MNIENELFDIVFHRHVLKNGAVLLTVPKEDTGLVAVNMLIRSGSKDEDPEMTGLAHLMEHLMFSGTVRYPAFDRPVAGAGGMNNAFTGQDVTCYYTVLPAEYLPLAMDMEADRLVNLVLDEKSIAVQKNVVTEEFRQRYLNQPYGDMNHLLSSAAWSVHPYKWPTIGVSPDHIEKATACDVTGFFRDHYNPSNIIISVAGNVDPGEVVRTAEKFFGDIPGRPLQKRALPPEPVMGRMNKTVVFRDVPSSYLLVAYPAPGSSAPGFTGFTFLADILGQGIVSRLHTALVKDKNIFTRVSAGLTGTTDPGLLTISGMLHENTDPCLAAEEIQHVVDDFAFNRPAATEMKAVVNGTLTNVLLKRTSALNLALEIAGAEYEGDASRINKVVAETTEITSDDVSALAKEYLVESNRIEVHYLKK